ncbi:MAG: xylulokinase [Phycisphaerae bacterium]
MRTLALDIGSSSVKAAFHDGRRFLARTRVSYATLFHGNRVEIDPAALLRAVLTAGKNLHAKNPDVISFCALSTGLTITNQHFKPRTNIITHQDRRSTHEALALTNRLGKTFLLRHTANLPYPGGIGTSSLAWLQQHHPALLKNARIGQLSSLVGNLLTNEWKIDPSQAVFLGLWDIRSNKWNAELCRELRIPLDALPACHYADEPLGTLTPDLAKTWNIPAGTPVVGGFVDTSAAVLQTPMRPGQLTHNCGSTDVLALSLPTPHPAEGLLTRPVGTRPKKGEAPWLSVLTIAASGSALEWARRELFGNMPEKSWIKLVQQTCNNIHAKDLTNSTLPTCIPTFSGNRATLEQPPGAAFGNLHLATTNQDLLASLLRALALQSAAHYHALAKLHPPQRQVFSIGSLTDLASIMHRTWNPGKSKHTFTQLEGDSMTGLIELACRATSP